jgi:hypothetical protein
MCNSQKELTEQVWMQEIRTRWPLSRATSSPVKISRGPGGLAGCLVQCLMASLDIDPGCALRVGEMGLQNAPLGGYRLCDANSRDTVFDLVARSRVRTRASISEAHTHVTRSISRYIPVKTR